MDDVNITFSDEEELGEELNLLSKKRYKGYGDQEESDRDEAGRSNKHKKVITVNPTEGFRYSDIFLVSLAGEGGREERGE